MPLALILGVFDVILVVHAAKTGRFSPWAYVILLIPVFGALAYVAVELVPEWLGGVQGQKARKRFVTTLDPERRYRALVDELAITDTIANREALAAECLALGKFEEAKHHFDEIVARPLGEEPVYFLGRARAESVSAGRRTPSRRSTTCAAGGRTTSRPTAISSMPARWRRPVGPRRRSRSSRRWRTIFRAPRRACATACCSGGSAGKPRPSGS